MDSGKKKPQKTDKTSKSPHNKHLKSVISCEDEINHQSHTKILQASRKHEANIKKELRMVILKNIESFNDRVYHSQNIEFRPIQKIDQAKSR